ncbi:MAG TPA: hypothetical protein VGJ78_19040 [Vicinamibacterales bacterium]|jgi:hypothetical protein
METDHPILSAAVVLGLYFVFSAALWFVDATFMKLEFPWTWHWLLWTVVFSPAVGATIFAAVTYVPDARRLGALYGIALVGVLAAMEACALLDAAFTPAIATMIAVSFAIVFMFRVVARRSM